MALDDADNNVGSKPRVRYQVRERESFFQRVQHARDLSRDSQNPLKSLIYMKRSTIILDYEIVFKFNLHEGWKFLMLCRRVV